MQYWWKRQVYITCRLYKEWCLYLLFRFVKDHQYSIVHKLPYYIARYKSIFLVEHEWKQFAILVWLSSFTDNISYDYLQAFPTTCLLHSCGPVHWYRTNGEHREHHRLVVIDWQVSSQWVYRVDLVVVIMDCPLPTNNTHIIMSTNLAHIQI
jgi:hypothetical protein